MPPELSPPAPSGPSLRQRLERRLDELPVLPAAITRLMSLDRDAPTYFHDVRKVVEVEPAFSARILSAANSAASAPRIPIADVLAAILRVGSVSAADLLLSASVARVFVPRDPWEKGLWRHALQTAFVARHLATAVHDPEVHPNVAYTAGLLHDIGRFVLFQEAPDELRRIEQAAWDSPEGLVRAERAICGLHHAEIGALACAKWSLPDVVTAVVRDHHLAPTDPTTSTLLALIRLADEAAFGSALPPGVHAPTDRERAARLEAARPGSLALSPEELGRLIDTGIAEAEAAAFVLGVHAAPGHR